MTNNNTLDSVVETLNDMFSTSIAEIGNNIMDGQEVFYVQGIVNREFFNYKGKKLDRQLKINPNTNGVIGQIVDDLGNEYGHVKETGEIYSLENHYTGFKLTKHNTIQYSPIKPVDPRSLQKTKRNIPPPSKNDYKGAMPPPLPKNYGRRIDKSDRTKPVPMRKVNSPEIISFLGQAG